MNALSRTSLRNRLERLIGVVVVLSMAAAGVSSALASELPGVAGNQPGLAQDSTVSECEAQFAQAALRNAGLYTQQYAASECEAQLTQAAPDRQSTTAPLAGLALLRGDVFGFDLWRPAGWMASVLAYPPVPGYDQQIIYLAPGTQNGEAHFTIQALDLGKEQGGADLAALIDSFDGVVHPLPNAQVEWQSHSWSGNVLTFDAWYSYRFHDTGGKVWVRWLYAGTHMYILTAEAPSTAEFDRLQPSFLAMMVTFRIDGQIGQTALNASDV